MIKGRNYIVLKYPKYDANILLKVENINPMFFKNHIKFAKNMLVHILLIKNMFFYVK